MATSSPSPKPNVTGREPVEIASPVPVAPDVAWRRLCNGLSASWLDEIRDHRMERDDLDTSLDIWAVALIAALKDPARRATAATMLGRLRRLSDEKERRDGRHV